MYYVATVAAHYLRLERYIHGFFWVYKKRNLGLKLEKFSLEILDFQAEWLEKRNWDLRNLWSVNKYGVSIFGISLKNYSFSLSAGARMAHRRGLLQRRWLMGVGLGERPFFFSFFFLSWYLNNNPLWQDYTICCTLQNNIQSKLSPMSGFSF